MPAVMVCDDEQWSVEPLVDRLRYEGIDVVVTDNAQSCLSESRRRPFDLFILDLLLGPNSNPWNGLELAEKLVEEQLASRSKIVAMSGNMPEMEQEALEFGVRFLRKPVNINEILTLIIEHLDSRTQVLEDIDHIYQKLGELSRRSSVDAASFEKEINALINRLRNLQEKAANDMLLKLKESRKLESGRGWRALESAVKVLREMAPK